VRLIGLRRGSIIAEFEFSGSRADIDAAISKVEANLGGNIRRALCEAVDAGTGCQLELLRSIVVPGRSERAKRASRLRAHSKTEEQEVAAIWIVLASAVMCSPILLKLGLRCRRRREIANVPDTLVPSSPQEAMKDADKLSIASSGSTCTPKEMVDCEVQTVCSGELAWGSPMQSVTATNCPNERSISVEAVDVLI